MEKTHCDDTEFVIKSFHENRFISPSSGSFFLFGPRGTGKSTWLETFYPEAYTINLLMADVRRRLTGNPEWLSDIINEHPENSLFIRKMIFGQSK